MRRLTGLALLISATAAYGAAPVEEAGSAYSRPANAAQQPPQQPMPQSGASQGLVDLHFQLQELREEVRQLRGVVEEQANELQQLRQRQMDDYQDLDRRLGGQAGVSSASQEGSLSAMPDEGTFSPQSSSPAGSGREQAPQAEQTGSVDAANQKAEYEEAFNRLKARKIDEAQAGFKKFVAKYPQSQYSANAWYWLGEIYLLQNDLKGAEQAFSQVTGGFPAHSKASDAMFKLGKVYHLEGRNDQAKTVLTKVANGNSRSAALARAYLQENF